MGWARDGVRKRDFYFYFKLGPKRSTQFLKEKYEKKTFVWVNEDF